MQAAAESENQFGPVIARLVHGAAFGERKVLVCRSTD
jgi:hypothetical protein